MYIYIYIYIKIYIYIHISWGNHLHTKTRADFAQISGNCCGKTSGQTVGQNPGWVLEVRKKCGTEMGHASRSPEKVWDRNGA